MTCPECQHENPPGTKFCGECGAVLSAPCPTCSAVNPPGNKFCGECGTPLGAGARVSTPARAERRIVSVLFADLVGFTPFSESRDPEEVRDMLTRYFDRSREIVERFAGTVDKFIGDAVMAWWGAVEAQEDDAERAVRAGLELVDMVADLGTEIGVSGLALRAGVLTGETSVGPGGNEQGLVVGDLVNTASRLQSIAEPGTVVVGEPTRTIVADAIEFQPLGPQKVKGKEAPISAFRALRVVAERGGRGRAEGLEPPFVGRQDELRLLKDQLHATGRESRARLVSIVGDAGIGKSRLAWELQKYIDGIVESVYWHHGRSPAYGDGIAFWALGEMIRSRAGLTAEATDKIKARLKLRTAVAEYVPFEEERRWMEPRLAGLLGLDPMPPGDRNELFAAIRTFLHRVSDLGTTVLVFEDLHWADDGVLEFITDLIERSTHNPILVITLSRPDLLERHPGWGSGRRNHLALHLAPLPDTDMRALVTGMAPGIPDVAANAVVERAAGIPLYAVEFVRMLIGSGDLQRDGDTFALTGDLMGLSIPDSLAAVIGARLDRLDPGDRALIQDAAVLGQSFTIQGLAAVRGIDPSSLHGPLDDLVRQELLALDDDPRSPERGQYGFVQGLIREVAYGRLARPDRHERHRRVAEYFAGLGDPELAGVVASHFLSAHQTAPAGTEDLLERGRAALIDAAERAAGLQAHAQALSLYRQALDLAAAAAERAPILLDAARAAAWSGDTESGTDMARAAIAAMEEIGDAEGALRARTALAWALNNSFRADEAVEMLQPTYDLLDDFDTSAKVALGLEMSRAHMLNREYPESIEVADRVLPTAERIASPAELLDGIISKASAISYMGRTMEADAMLTGAIGIADQHGLQAQAIRALNNLGVGQAWLDPLSAIRSGADLLDRSKRFGGTVWLERARSDMADAYAAAGRFDDAEHLMSAGDSEHLQAFDQQIRHATQLFIDWARGNDREAPATLRTFVGATWGTSRDQQIIQGRDWLIASSYLAEGAWDQAFDLAIVLETPYAIAAALEAGAWSRDPDRVRSALEVVDDRFPRGRFRDALTRLGQAVLIALDGHREASAEAFSAGLDVLAQVGFPTDLARWQALFGALVGLDHPAALAAATHAKEWLRAAGAAGIERLVADGLPADEAGSRRAG